MTKAGPFACHKYCPALYKPNEIEALSPVYEREILFRILQGPLGWMLRDIATPDAALARISVAINWLRGNFEKSIPIEELAEMASLSVSPFYRHFKSVTALSPLQFQKRIRLLTARSSLLAGEGNATTIAFGVGYENPNQFSREHARFFGLPPSKDIARFRLR